MRINLGFIVGVVAIALSGCATPPQSPIYLAGTAVGSEAGRLGIAMAPLPEADTHLRGADCLLCLATASIANASLSSYAKTLPKDDLVRLKNEIAELLRKRGTEVVVLAEPVNIDNLPDYEAKVVNVAKKDFSGLRQKYNVDKLLVVHITSLGFLRTYAAYIPTSPPRGLLEGTGYIVNLKNNAYEWYERVNVIRGAEGNWDEPPKFPGLTNAYFQSLEVARDSFLRPFTQ
jgi:hypothetical protein